jgi:hypothetical protein
MIDQQHNNIKHNTDNDNDSNDKVFSTEVCNSLANDSSYMNYLFGLKRNDKKCNTVNNKDDNNTNINNASSSSVMNVNKIITLINDLEHKHNKLLTYMQQRNINNNITTTTTTTTHVTSLKPKHPTLLINSNKYGFINTHINISKQNEHKEKHINLSHRGSFFSSSYTHRISHNNKKNYNTNITNHAITNRTSSKPTSKDYGGICFTINTSTNKKSPQTDRFKHKIKEILIKKTIHINSNNTSRNRYHYHQRNHNCLLNSKGLMFNSKTNNTIYYSNVNKIL